MRRILVTAVVILLTAGGALPAVATPGQRATGPKLETPVSTLASALTCPSAFAHRRTDAVLLVHGTAVTADEHWGWNYGKHLAATGRDVCRVELPERALDDIQIAAEYVVHAVRTLGRSHGAVDVIGHSQGAIEPRWAIKWWPDVAATVDDAILLAGPHHGTASADGSCALGSCAPAIWQMRTGSAFMSALNEGDETPTGPDWSSLYSHTDELVQPSSTAVLSGATNVAIQDLCPGRPVHHAGLNSDPVVWSLVVATLDAPGPVDPSSFDAATCLQPWYPTATAADVVGGNVLLYGNGAQAVATHEQVSAEPALRPYAR